MLDVSAVLLLVGLGLVVSAIAGLAGLWWSLFTAGILLAALAVLLARGQRRSTPAAAAPTADEQVTP